MYQKEKLEIKKEVQELIEWIKASLKCHADLQNVNVHFRQAFFAPPRIIIHFQWDNYISAHTMGITVTATFDKTNHIFSIKTPHWPLHRLLTFSTIHMSYKQTTT